MKLPDNWNTIQGKEYGAFTAVPPGGYICRIVKAEEKTSQSGRHMLALYFDICEGEYADYYKKDFDSNTNADKKWRGAYHQLTEGNSESYFKGMIIAIEKSNPGYTFTGDESTLRGKLFGAVFGEEEYRKRDGAIGTSSKMMYLVKTDSIRDGKYTVPDKKLLKPSNDEINTYMANSTGFAEPVDDEELPF